MSKPSKRDFCLAADHELAAAECADPFMREVWLLTAAEWRRTAQEPAAPRSRRTKGKGAVSRGVWADFLVLAQQAGADAILDFRHGDQICLIDGPSLGAWRQAGADAVVTRDGADTDAMLWIMGLLKADALDLIV